MSIRSARVGVTRVVAGVVGSVVGLGGGAFAQAPFVEPDVTVLRAHAADQPGTNFGFIAEALGDLDQDGVDDYAIGAPTDGAGGALAGRLFVYSGGSGAVLAEHVGAVGDRLGFACARAGDLDRDGVPDYVVGGPGSPRSVVPGLGRMVVYSGADHRVLLDVAGTTARAQFGYEVDGAGDLDADGVIDFLVGAPFSSGGGVSTRGRVVAVSGVDGHTLWERDGDGAIALFGSGLASLGVDRNGDGAAEVVVGAFGAGPLGTGLAYELSGRDGVVRRVLVPDASAGSFGWFFAHPAGDVDGDDAVDILVSDFSDGAAGALSGRAYVFSGARSVAVQPTGAEPGNAPLLSAARVSVIAARSVGEGFGPGRGAGDLDGDGRADLILAGYTNSTGGAVAGAVHLVRGIDGTTLRTITGAVAGASLGFDALIVGDLDRDGHRDILITGVGVAYVVAGR